MRENANQNNSEYGNFKLKLPLFNFKLKVKLQVLGWMRKYLSWEKAKTLGSAFIDSQFNYVPFLATENAFKNDEKCFLFQHKSSFRSQVI